MAPNKKAAVSWPDTMSQKNINIYIEREIYIYRYILKRGKRESEAALSLLVNVAREKEDLDVAATAERGESCDLKKRVTGRAMRCQCKADDRASRISDSGFAIMNPTLSRGEAKEQQKHRKKRPVS